VNKGAILVPEAGSRSPVEEDFPQLSRLRCADNERLLDEVLLKCRGDCFGQGLTTYSQEFERGDLLSGNPHPKLVQLLCGNAVDTFLLYHNPEPGTGRKVSPRSGSSLALQQRSRGGVPGRSCPVIDRNREWLLESFPPQRGTSPFRHKTEANFEEVEHLRDPLLGQRAEATDANVSQVPSPSDSSVRELDPSLRHCPQRWRSPEMGNEFLYRWRESRTALGD